MLEKYLWIDTMGILRAVLAQMPLFITDKAAGICCASWIYKHEKNLDINTMT